MDSSAYLITVLSSSMLPKTVSAIMDAASPLATFTLSPFTLIGATMRRPVGASVADAVVVGAAAACTGNPEEVATKAKALRIVQHGVTASCQ